MAGYVYAARGPLPTYVGRALFLRSAGRALGLIIRTNIITTVS